MTRKYCAVCGELIWRGRITGNRKRCRDCAGKKMYKKNKTKGDD